jgi:hypothetical protein
MNVRSHIFPEYFNMDYIPWKLINKADYETKMYVYILHYVQMIR